MHGSPVRVTWWKQDLIPLPEPEREGGDGTPGLGAYLGSSGEGRPIPPGYPHYRPPQAAASLEEQQEAWRVEWEARDLDAEAERDRLWAAAHLPSDLL